MFSNTRTTRVEWGDCDPAGIIFYVRYFDFFDVSTTMLIERAIGMKKIAYLKAYDFLGHPLAETRAKFRLPTRFGDEADHLVLEYQHQFAALGPKMRRR